MRLGALASPPFPMVYLCAVAVEISVEIVDNVHLTSSFGFEFEELKIVSVARARGTTQVVCMRWLEIGWSLAENVSPLNS